LAASNPARPEPGVKLCTLGEIGDPGSKGFRFREDSILFMGFVVRRGDLVAGYVDSCPHASWPLAPMDDEYLTRTGSFILCSGHGAVFELEHGICVGGPCLGSRLPPWPVEVRDGCVFTA
jgi:nitrite reductase/ring-hydroxylating ferredoxin subunit